MSRIFISYRRADAEGYAGRLYDHLLNHFSPDDIFMDVDTIRPGQDFVQVLENAVSQCDVLLALIGNRWLSVQDEDGTRRLDQRYDFVRIEIATALEREVLVIPILFQGAKMPTVADLPEPLAPLARRHAVELGHKSFAYDVGKLAEVIQTAIEEKKAKQALRSRKDQTTPEIVSEKMARLAVVRESLLNFTATPLYSYRVKNNWSPVFGAGNADAKLMFIGEAPGKTEGFDGFPFTGASGDILDEMFASIGLQRSDVYLTNMLKDHAPKEQYTPAAMVAYAPFLEQEMAIIQPEVVIPLGAVAVKYILTKYNLPEKRQGMTQLSGKILTAHADYGEIHILPLSHPASVLYRPDTKARLLKDFQSIREFV